MKTLKLGLFSLLAILAVSVFLTSCEQEEIISDNQPNITDMPSLDINSDVKNAILAIINQEPNSIESRHVVHDDDSKSLGRTSSGPSGSYFLKARAEVSHGSHGGGYYKSNAEVCVVFDQDPVGLCVPSDDNIWVKQWHYRWNNGSPYACTATGFVKNSGDRQEVEVKVNHPEPTPVCGDDWYGNFTQIWYYNPVSGNAELEWLWSGWHYLPA